jgi:hypothetical protein
MTPAEEEAHVRSSWVDAEVLSSGEIVIDRLIYSRHSAFLFTKQREAEIADVEEEIGFLGGPYCLECPSVERILAREQAVLAELRRGWKEQG